MSEKVAQASKASDPEPPLGYMIFENRANDDRLIKSLLSLKFFLLMLQLGEMSGISEEYIHVSVRTVYSIQVLSLVAIMCDVNMMSIFRLLVFADFTWFISVFASMDLLVVRKMFLFSGGIVVWDAFAALLCYISWCREEDRILNASGKNSNVGDSCRSPLLHFTVLGNFQDASFQRRQDDRIENDKNK